MLIPWLNINLPFLCDGRKHDSEEIYEQKNSGDIHRTGRAMLRKNIFFK